MKTIFVIDDDEAILANYGLALAHAGYRVVMAADGMQGVELARRRLPDLVLCDINMPGMDGRNVSRLTNPLSGGINGPRSPRRARDARLRP